MNLKGLKIRVWGRVQGVFFRSNAREKALEFNLKGWVRNEPDGEVLIMAEGLEENLLKFLQWCKRGPDLARVDDVEHEWLDHTKEFTSFRVVH